ncbi:MAG: tail fiber domain-containing protein [Candidatus Fonsibacter sp.]
MGFTTTSADYKGRILYDHSANEFKLSVSGGAVNMQLNSVGLYVGGPLVSSSDKRLKFNEKPLINALDVINKLEPLEYDQTHDLLEQYTTDTPQSHQFGFIAQSVQQIGELKHVVVGGDIEEDGNKVFVHQTIMQCLHTP